MFILAMCRDIRRRTLIARSAAECWWSAWVYSQPSADPQGQLPILPTADSRHLARLRAHRSLHAQMRYQRKFKMHLLMAALAGRLLAALLAIAAMQQARAGAQKQKVRQAGVAGSFYPADPSLTAMMDDLLAMLLRRRLLIRFSRWLRRTPGMSTPGRWPPTPTQRLKGHKYARVVVIAPTHYVAFDFTSIYDGDAYATPLGTCPWTRSLRSSLVKMSSTMQLSGEGHDATSAGGEHAVEVQLPWLQRVLGNFEAGAHRHGRPELREQPRVGSGAGQADPERSKQGGTLILASSDLSHYHTYDDAETIDHKTLNALAGVGLLQHVAQLSVADLGGLRRRAHCGRHDCRRTHGSQSGAGA